MFTPTLTYDYGTCKGESCLIMGYQEKPDGALLVLVSKVDGGELILANLEDVLLDPTKLAPTRPR